MARETVTDRDLARLLDEQIDAMQTVLEALDGERRALNARDGEALLKAISSKAQSVANADMIEIRRRDLLELLARNERAGGSARGYRADAGISQRWQQVLALTQQCRALNDANGQMIRGQRRRVEGTLCVLRGEPAGANEYGPDGGRRSPGAQRSLGTY